MKLEIEKLLHHLDGKDMTPQEKEAYIRFVWNFMEARVDLIFQQDSVQLSRGKNDISNLQSHGQSLDSKGNPVSYCFGKAANDNEFDEERSRDEQQKRA